MARSKIEPNKSDEDIHIESLAGNPIYLTEPQIVTRASPNKVSDPKQREQVI